LLSLQPIAIVSAREESKRMSVSVVGSCGVDNRASHFLVTIQEQSVATALDAIRRKYPGRNTNEVVAVHFIGDDTPTGDQRQHIIGTAILTPEEAAEISGKPSLVHEIRSHGWARVAKTPFGFYPFQDGDVLVPPLL